MPVSYRRFRDDIAAAIILNEGTDEEHKCQGYCHHALGTFLYYTLIIFTAGFALLVFKWRPVWAVKVRKKRCNTARADSVVLTSKYKERSVVDIIKQKVSRSFPDEFSYSILAKDESGGDCLYEEISDQSGLTGNEGSYFKYFIHRHIKYYWDYRIARFKKLRGYDSNTLCSDFLERFHGLTSEQQMTKLQVYEENKIEVEVKSYFKLFVEEVLNPFYIFQIGSVILWYLDNYLYFALCIIFITSISMIVSLYETKKQSQTLHDMVSSNENVTVTVKRRDGMKEVIPSVHLVPGDLLVIPPQGCTMSCDAVLVAGTCIVNESMLTGESVPITKVQLPHQDDPEIFNPDQHKRHTLFCGTQVIQTRFYGGNDVIAVVIRTGFSTAKGELVRSILYPRPMGFKFYRDAMRFILLMFVIALAGMGYSLYISFKDDYTIKKAIIRMLDIVTIVVPPTLPAAMTVGSIIAQSRLKKQQIFCISPARINVCGKVKVCCFDKTGTLTEEGLDLSGIIPVANKTFLPMVGDPSHLDEKSALMASMATCHSLTHIDGELRGDPLDLKMFQATQWEIEEPSADITRHDMLCPTVVHPLRRESFTNDDYMSGREKVPYEIGVIRQFPFSSDLQRMSVIARVLDQPQMNLYVKGAPEKIVTLSNPDTIPPNFVEFLESFTVQGNRVIAVAWKPLNQKITWHQAQKLKRNDVEQDLTLVGLLIMQNTLKRETTPVIMQLNNAGIRTLMATGDNMHTAISVAHDCGMVLPLEKVIILTAHPPSHGNSASLKMEFADEGRLSRQNSSNGVVQNGGGDVHVAVTSLPSRYHFSTNGKSFAVIQRYFPDILPKLVVKGTIFARMAPEQKAQLVKELRRVGYLVAMCGDGANDCSALKAADVGISLSEAEASVAAPFTSANPNITCVPVVIKEGRCALVTSFGVFKYMALYSMVQFISVLILYTFGVNLGDMQFLYIDLFLATIMAIVMSYTRSYDELVKERPAGSLVSLAVVSSIILQIMLAAVIQIAALMHLRFQPWYVQTEPNYSDDFKMSWETTVIFSVSTFQYVTLAIVFAKGPPYRKYFFTNVWMVLALIFFTAWNFVFLLYPCGWIADFLMLNKNTYPDVFEFRLWMLIFPVINFFLALGIEILAASQLMKHISRVMKCKSQPKHIYRRLEKEIDSDSSLFQYLPGLQNMNQ